EAFRRVQEYAVDQGDAGMFQLEFAAGQPADHEHGTAQLEGTVGIVTAYHLQLRACRRGPGCGQVQVGGAHGHGRDSSRRDSGESGIIHLFWHRPAAAVKTKVALKREKSSGEAVSLEPLCPFSIPGAAPFPGFRCAASGDWVVSQFEVKKFWVA